MTSDLHRRSLLLGGGLLTAGAVGASVSQNTGPTDVPRARGDVDASIGFNNAFRALSNDRTSPPSLRGWGVGAMTLPRGLWVHRTPIAFADSQVGYVLRGEAAYATTHLFNIVRGAALPFRTYVAVMVSDLYLRNMATVPGDSVGIALDPIGGGGPLTVKRVAIDGFGTGIRVGGTGNGDKGLVEQVSFGTSVAFDNERNKQAVGWTFLNCSGICGTTHFRLGGAGEVGIGGYVGNVLGSFLEFPEASGNGGSGNVPARVSVTGTQLEYHGDGARMLVDASRSRELTNQGGANADIVLREVTFASGATPPDPKNHVVIQVGDDESGCDSIRVKQEGGWIEGVIRHGSRQQGELNRRWSFRDAVRAPDPAFVQLKGIGSHPLMEWRANENVPIDQYRGGQAFTGAIDAQKAFLWRHAGPALLNTGVAKKQIGARFGGDFDIGGFPPGTTQLALGVFLDESLRDGCDLELRQFGDAAFRNPLGPPLALPAGTPKGLHRVHDLWHVLDRGVLHVRVTLPARGLGVRGAIVPFYFPYMGS